MGKSKSVILNVLLAVPIGLLFILFVNKLIEILTHDTVAEARIKKNLIIAFIIGIIGILIAWFIFYKSKVKNLGVMLGLMLGSIYLMINSLILNWDKLSMNENFMDIVGEYDYEAMKKAIQPLAEELAIESSGEGVIVTAIKPGSPADDIGLQKGDYLVSIDKNDVKSTRDVVALQQERAYYWTLIIRRKGELLKSKVGG